MPRRDGIGSGSCPAPPEGEKGSGPIGAKHPEVRSGQLDLTPFPGPAIPTPSSIWPPSGRGWCWCRSSKARRTGRGPNWPQLARLHPDARGRLGGQEGKWSELLAALLVESASWKKGTVPICRNGPTNLRSVPGASHKLDLSPFSDPPDPNWPTLAGNSRGTRSRRDWRTSAPWRGGRRCDRRIRRPLGERRHEPLSFHPLLVGNLVLVNDEQRILAVRLDNGQPAWGQAATIYQSQLAGVVAPPLAGRDARHAAVHHDGLSRTGSSPGWARP